MSVELNSRLNATAANLEMVGNLTLQEVTEKDEQGTASIQICLQGVTAYINAGGRGTRLNQVFTPHKKIGISKALLTVGQPPLLLIEHQINKLLKAGMSSVVVGVGDHAHVAQHVTNRYRHIADVRPIFSPQQLGTGGDLLQALHDFPELFQEQTAISNVDTLLDIDEGTMLAFHREHAAGFTVGLTLNSNVPNEGAYYVDRRSKVIHCQETTNLPIDTSLMPEIAYRGSSTGAVIANTELLQSINWHPAEGPLSLYKDIAHHALQRGLAYGFDNGTRFFTDVGTVDTWAAAQENPNALEAYLSR